MTRYELAEDLIALAFDPDAGTVVTHYPGGRWSGGPVVPQDAEHAERLRITPLEHRLAHELAHHVLGDARRAAGDYGGNQSAGCRIIHRDATGRAQIPDEAALDEWKITSFTYFALGGAMRDPGEWGALIDLHRAGVDVVALAARYRWLLGAPRFGVSLVRL